MFPGKSNSSDPSGSGRDAKPDSDTQRPPPSGLDTVINQRRATCIEGPTRTAAAFDDDRVREAPRLTGRGVGYADVPYAGIRSGVFNLASLPRVFIPRAAAIPTPSTTDSAQSSGVKNPAATSSVTIP